MGERLWADIDEYAASLLHPHDVVLDEVLARSEAAGLPGYNVSIGQGVMLQIMARMVKARSILEIGTLGGYSTIYLARALPEGGRLITLEADPDHARVARENVAQAGLDSVVHVMEGDAQRTLPLIHEQRMGPFDFIFIDANKNAYPTYLDWSLKLSGPGTVIIGDNVVRGGAVLNGDSGDENVKGVRRLLELMADEPRLTATVVQTVGSKGYDGFVLGLVD